MSTGRSGWVLEGQHCVTDFFLLLWWLPPLSFLFCDCVLAWVTVCVYVLLDPSGRFCCTGYVCLCPLFYPSVLSLGLLAGPSRASASRRELVLYMVGVLTLLSTLCFLSGRCACRTCSTYPASPSCSSGLLLPPTQNMLMNPDYKIAFVLDRTSMFQITTSLTGFNPPPPQIT